MIDRVIPNWETINSLTQPLTAGELALVNYLDRFLPKDTKADNDTDLSLYDGWLIFVQPYLNGSRPDIVVFNPNVGLQIIEVKDWQLQAYSFGDEESGKGQRRLYVTDAQGKHEINSPVNQVKHYKEKIIGQLVPQMGEMIDSDSKGYGLIKTCLYFHKAKTVECKELFEHEIRDFFPIIGYDALTELGIKKIVPDASFSRSKFWRQEWSKPLLNWLNPPFHSLEQTTPLLLNKYQRRFSEPETGHYRVRGVAGSGKTQVLAWRAAKLAADRKRVLVLSFNITLWHYIRDMVQRAPFEFHWNHITFNHFHGFCKDVLVEYGGKWPSSTESEELFRESVPRAVLTAIAAKPLEKYDAILIDEGQDFFIEWYHMLTKFLSERDELVVVCDKKQNIYGRETEWLDKRRPGVEKFGSWIELKTIVRLPEHISNMAKEFSESYGLNQDVRVENIERPDLFSDYQEHTVWWNVDSKQWLDKIVEAYNLVALHGNSKHPSDTVILLPDFRHGNICVARFKSINLDVCHVFETTDDAKGRRHKRAFWMGDSRLKMSTVHSFKGWEALNVIIYIPLVIAGDMALYDRLIYTAITRTKQNLLVVNANQHYWEFGAKFSDEWH